MNQRRLRGIGVVGALALVGAACGDDDAGLSKAEWIEAAEAICADANDAFEALFEEGPPATPEATQRFVEDVVPILERRVSELRDLEAPEGDAEEIAEMLDRGEQGVDDVREASQSPEASVEIFNAEGGEDNRAFDESLAAYGAEACEEDEGEEEEEAAPPIAGAREVVVQGTEYAFSGLPPSVPAGDVNFVLDNVGGEEHELGVGRLKEGATAREVVDAVKRAGFGAALELLDGEPDFGIHEIGPGTRSDPSGLTVEPGSYILVCFVNAPDGERHAFKGMFAELEVT